MQHQKKGKNRIVFLPLLTILAVSLLLLIGLQQDPKKIASALIGKPFPAFHQPNLLQATTSLSRQDLPKQAFLLNVWGSWCTYCKKEHPFLMQLAKSLPIVGLNYRDKPQNALTMLAQMGNPFSVIIDDSRGELALNLGVDGAPETYLVDQDGVIRYRYTGALTPEIWQTFFIPILETVEGENAKVR